MLMSGVNISVLNCSYNASNRNMTLIVPRSPLVRCNLTNQTILVNGRNVTVNNCSACFNIPAPVVPQPPVCQNNVTANCTALFNATSRLATGFMNCGFYARNASNQTVRLNFTYLSNSTLFVCNSTNVTANRACNACLDSIIPVVIPGGNNGSQGNSSNN